MWSGPRNISTALMRSFEARGDAAVVDEPLYAHYLKQTGLDHPGRDDVIAHHDADWRVVVAGLLGDIPNNKPIYYQKHMAHHLLPEVDLDWIENLRSAFLIREPRAMLASLAKVIPNPTIEQTGLPQQERLDQWLGERGIQPPVVDSRDVLMNPAGTLRALCDSLELPYTDRMLSWEAGPRTSDGVWAKYWYANVERSTGFAASTPKNGELPQRLKTLVKQCERIYQSLYDRRLKPVETE